MAAPLKKQVFYSVTIGKNTFDVTGRKMTPKGYIVLCIKEHPKSDASGYVMEHRVMVEKKIGRLLKENEVVHHLNEIRHDNRLSNLELMDRSEHTILHHLGSERSDETKALISKKAKARLKLKKNHPSYKDVDDELKTLLKKDLTRTEIGKILGIRRQTVAQKIKYLELEK